MGSRVMAGELKPDAVIAVDVNHDFVAAPNVSDERFTPLEMGKGYTIAAGAIVSEQLNTILCSASRDAGIPFKTAAARIDAQMKPVGLTVLSEGVLEHARLESLGFAVNGRNEESPEKCWGHGCERVA